MAEDEGDREHDEEEEEDEERHTKEDVADWKSGEDDDEDNESERHEEDDMDEEGNAGGDIREPADEASEVEWVSADDTSFLLGCCLLSFICLEACSRASFTSLDRPRVSLVY